jgi:hypothetical protein
LIKPDALPISAEDVQAIRARLVQALSFELVARDDVRCLFVRSPRPEPDPVNDLEAGLNAVPDWALLDLTDVVLLGTRQNFHVPARAAQPIIERRRRVDEAALKALRAHLDPHYGHGLHRVTGDPASTNRLGLRIPKPSVQGLDDHDLNRFAQALGPDLQTLQDVRVAYVLADEDHVRLRGDEVVADLTPRWRDVQRAAAESAIAVLAPPEPEPSVPPRAAPAPVSLPRRRPKKVINVRPIVDLEEHLDAIGVQEKDDALLQQAEAEIDARLTGAGYDLMRRVEHDGVPFALAAERTSGYPRRLLVRCMRRCDRADADALLRSVRALEADLVLVLTTDLTDAAARRLTATKVQPLHPSRVSSLTL